MKYMSLKCYIKTTKNIVTPKLKLHTRTISRNSGQKIGCLFSHKYCTVECKVEKTDPPILYQIYDTSSNDSLSSKKLFLEVSFCRMSTSSKHICRTFDEIVYAHPAAILYRVTTDT